MADEATIEPIDSAGRLSLNLSDAPSGLNLKHVYYFHHVATEGSIARAARRLNLSQSTISEQIKALEEFLEKPLFDRRRGGLRLNESGQRVFEHSKVMFKAARRMVQDLNPARNEFDWILEVGISPMVSMSFTVERLLPLFQLKDVTPRIRFGGYADLLEDLLSGELDLVLSENEPPEPHRPKVGLSALSESALVVVASPVLAEKVTSYPNKLSALPFVSYTQNSRYRWDLDAWFFEHGLNPEIAGEVDDVSLLTLLAQRSVGAVAVPEAVASPAIRAGKLVKLGSVDGAAAIVYAHYSEVNTPELVRHAVSALVEGGKRVAPELS